VATSNQAASPSLTTKSGKPLQAEQIDRTWSSKLKFDTKLIKKNHAGIRGYEISADYPQIPSARTPSTRRFNRWIKRKITGYVAQFKGLERSAEIHDQRRHLPKVAIDESLEIGYQVYYSDDRLISLRLTHTVMALGQMHPIDYYETINYDLKKEHDLRASDVLKPGYLKTFSRFCRDQLKEKYDLQYTTDDWVKGGTTPKQRNFKNWNLVPDGILISFEDYQIAAHAFGQAELIIPYSVLKRFLRRTNLIGPFVTRRSKTISHQNQRDESPKLRDIFVDGNRLSYRGYTVSKLQKRVKLVYPPEYDNPPQWTDATYAVVRRNGRTLSKFDSGLLSPLVNSTEFGLFSFLGGKTKQLVVSQDLPRTGTQWVASLLPRFRIIFDGQAWGVGRESDDMGIIDLDHDGVFEISVPITDFYELQDKMSMSQIPLPDIIFKYDLGKRKYLPANHQNYLVEEMKDSDDVDTNDEPNHRSLVLRKMLTLIYAGKRTDAWKRFDQVYKLSDKEEIRRRVNSILSRQPVYKFIYNR
jgi:hypothetical protein